MYTTRSEIDDSAVARPEQPFVSVVIPTSNRRSMLAACLDAVSRLDYPNFEALVCVDPSSATRGDEVRAMADGCERVRVLVSDGRSGASATRNLGIAETRGAIVFFTDDDVLVAPDWLTRGVARFEDPDVVGIEGRLVYVDDGYRLRYGDRVVENLAGGLYMTANAAYRREALVAAGMFDEGIASFEDRELAHRVCAHGEIVFAPECVAYHQHDRYTVREFMREATRVRMMVKVMKRTGDCTPLVGRVYAPSKIAAILCPPVILLRLLSRSMSSRSDVLFFFLSYPRLWYERLLLWRTALDERFFVL